MGAGSTPGGSSRTGCGKKLKTLDALRRFSCPATDKAAVRAAVWEAAAVVVAVTAGAVVAVALSAQPNVGLPGCLAVMPHWLHQCRH